jgi:hypothetical protein
VCGLYGCVGHVNARGIIIFIRNVLTDGCDAEHVEEACLNLNSTFITGIQWKK